MKGITGLILFAVTCSAEDTSPVTKIVGLIKELKAKIEADGKTEQTMYNKYACWCETTSARKAKNIHQGIADLKNLGAKILELKSAVTSYSNDIHHLTMEMTENQAAQDQATGIRTKENTAYLAEKTEMETTINALQRAIEVLSGAGTKTGLLQTKASETLLSVAKGVDKIVKKMPNIDKLLSPKQLKLIRTFAKDPAEFYDQKAEKAASYNPASATIMGILKDMYDTFSMNLEKGTETEAIAYKNYESLMGVKGNEMEQLSKERLSKEGKKAAAEEEQAQTQATYDETDKQLAEDTAFFDDTKAACAAKADEWSERVRARTEELAGINKGLEILTGDDARALFNKAIKPGMETFMQTDMTSNPKQKAFDALKKGAAKAKSLRLLAIAAQVKAGGHFDAVTGEIDKMMKVIQEEEKADINKKDWCKDEIHKNEQEAARYEYKVEKKDALIGRLRAKLDELETILINTIEEIQNTKKDLKEMEDTRKADHAAYAERKTDDESAVAVLGSAIEAMSAFYKNNKIDVSSLSQQNSTIQKKQPTFERSPDLAPDASFSSAGKSGGESKGILSIMTMLKEDLEDEITNAVKMEKEDQFYFERSVRQAHQLLAELKDKKETTEQQIADMNTEIDNQWNEREDIQGMYNEEKLYLGSIEPDCQYLYDTFDERRSKRQAETQSLIDAKGMLEGSDAAGTGGEAAAAEADAAAADAGFVQIGEHREPKMSFSGASFLG